MTSAFDPRIVKVSIEFEDGIYTFENLSIYAVGRKFLAATFNQCECRVYNLTEDHRNYILSRTSPLNTLRKPIKMTLDVGRESYGTFRLFDGYIRASNTTQPPDIGITLSALTNSFEVGTMLSDTHASIAKLSVIAKNIAKNNNLKLDFQATDKQINNFSYSGAAAFQVQELNLMGGVLAYVNNDTLIVLDAGKPRRGEVRLLSAATGMIGIPQFAEKGVTVRMMLDNTVDVGTAIRIESEVFPASNGDFIVQSVLFEVASRDQPFFYTLDCLSRTWFAGTL